MIRSGEGICFDLHVSSFSLRFSMRGFAHSRAGGCNHRLDFLSLHHVRPGGARAVCKSFRCKRAATCLLRPASLQVTRTSILVPRPSPRGTFLLSCMTSPL